MPAKLPTTGAMARWLTIAADQTLPGVGENLPVVNFLIITDDEIEEDHGNWPMTVLDDC